MFLKTLFNFPESDSETNPSLLQLLKLKNKHPVPNKMDYETP